MPQYWNRTVICLILSRLAGFHSSPWLGPRPFLPCHARKEQLLCFELWVILKEPSIGSEKRHSWIISWGPLLQCIWHNVNPVYSGAEFSFKLLQTIQFVQSVLAVKHARGFRMHWWRDHSWTLTICSASVMLAVRRNECSPTSMVLPWKLKLCRQTPHILVISRWAHNIIMVPRAVHKLCLHHTHIICCFCERRCNNRLFLYKICLSAPLVVSSAYQLTNSENIIYNERQDFISKGF